MDILEAILRLAHILGAIIWMGFGLYNYLVTTRVEANMPVANINYHLGVAKYSKFGQLMGIAALVTTVAGLALWGVARPFSIYFGLSMFILSVGSLAGLAAFGHGFAIGKKSDALDKALIAAEQNGVVNPSKHAELGDMIAKLNRSANISLAMMGVALLCMSTYSAF